MTTLIMLPVLLAQPPAGAKGEQPKDVPPLLRQYDFGNQLRTLENPASAPAQVRPELATPSTPSGLPNGSVPKDFKPNMDVPLTATALEAVRVSEDWQGEKNAPSRGRDGRVIFSYGAGLPTVVCAPLRVCMVELEAGEKVVGDPHIGDSVRWNISLAMYGTGEQATAVIILKPQTPGLDTNLLVTTDRRAYYLRLISKPEDYVARVAFAYPEDDTRKWERQLAEQQAAAKQAQHAAEMPPAMIAVENMNFDYVIRGGDEHLRPVRVYDDGAKTYIQMPPEIQHREAPVLLVIGADGKGEMTNYRVKDQTYIVDRVFDRANLVLGSGKKAQKVEISRGKRQ
ncbi:MAG TPA: P-type conjugative transfer protein TrbG [Bryobacteraceae bacterium]|nr:P-type conjugative transfer protein TrbG [Bryobacteraceae bacterium]HUA83682.1 P-type conjugative transfer protein TrbG [Bryobacteraceae bacterium]